MKLGFLFGAGVSIAGGSPTTSKLTETVLSNKNVLRHSDGTYFLGAEDHTGLSRPSDLQEIRDFLAFLERHANTFFLKEKEKRRKANYEDLYYLVTQLADAVDEYENPAVSGLLRCAQRRFPSRSPSFDLFKEARQYIKGIVSDILRKLGSWP